MARKTFTFADFSKDCDISPANQQLSNRAYGIKITVPEALQKQWPFNASAYDFLQFLRPQIQQYGFIELPDLKFNKTNYTLAMRSPKEHSYSSNPFLTDYCQSPHQDTPPYPTAFGLEQRREFFATWLMTSKGVNEYTHFQQQHPELSIIECHKALQPISLQQGWGILVNQNPGLILIDNSQHCALYHARTCNFQALNSTPDFATDSAMYAFNEVGLLHYIDELDSRRGLEHRDESQRLAIADFMQQEKR
ncbi:MAG: hypothetical protein HRU20_25565 [Pseudomonadales bacterium]|nr:hypothetical protein [Pseudomonadales bacterium]